MKIAVIGSHGTGKTTLCNKVVKKYGFNLIPDVTPLAHNKGFEINEKTTLETQLWILSKQLELHKNIEENWISEKALWDNYIYGKYAIEDTNALKLIKKLSLVNSDYDLVVYCPIEFPLADDGLRSQNEQFQREIDVSYKKFLKDNGIEFVTIYGDKMERFEKIKQHIDSLKNNS